MAYPVYEDNGGMAAADAATIDVAYPATVNENDILITILIDNDDDTFTTPSGWTKVHENTGGSIYLCTAWYWKRATGTESGTETFTSNSDSGDVLSGTMFRFSGCVTSGAPYEDHTTAGDDDAATSAATISAITTEGSERLCVCLMAEQDNRAITEGSTYTLETQLSTDVGGDQLVGLCTYEQATADDVAADSVTWSGPDRWHTYTFALIPTSGVVATTCTLALAYEAPVLTQAHTLVVADVDIDLAFDGAGGGDGLWDIGAYIYPVGGGIILVQQDPDIVVADISLALAYEAPVLTQAHTLTVADIAHALAFDAPVLTQAHTLVVADAALDLAFDAPVVTHNHMPVVLADITHALAFEAPVLTQAHVLAVNDAAIALAFDAPALTQAHTLVVADADIDLAFESPAVSEDVYELVVGTATVITLKAVIVT